MAKRYRASDFRTIKISNKQRVQIDPRTKYARTIRAEANVINDMLKALDEEGYSNSWASKTLFNKIGTNKINIIKNNKIDVGKISKTSSMSNLTYIKKALNDFKASKTSTVKGIQSRIDDERQFIAEQTDNQEFANELTDEEIGRIYEVFNDTDYKQLTESGMYDSDEIFTFITTAKEQDYGIRKFQNMVKTYSEDSPDVETRKMFKNIYDKYVASQI